MTEAEAKQHLDAYYAGALGYQPDLLYAPGVHFIPLTNFTAPLSLFKRSLVIAHAPTTPTGKRSCVLAVHPRLLEPLAHALADLAVAQVFEPSVREQLTQLVRRHFPNASTPPGGAVATIRYVTPDTFRPFYSPANASVERLDERQVANLTLLGRYNGGVYVLRDGHGEILSRAGIRQEAEMVWEIGVRTEQESQRGRGLAKMVVTAATQAILDAGRVPLYVHSATNLASEKVALALGYQRFSDELLWFLPE